MSLPSRIFVTGANGFIGRALMQRLEMAGVATCGMDLQAEPERHVVAGNIAETGSWQEAMRGCELIVHTAAVVSNTARPEAYRQVSVGGTQQVIQAALRAGVPRLVHLSSVAAYGLDFDQPQSESSPITTLSGYAYCDAKAASEHPVLAAHAAGEIAATIIRPGDVYGSGSRPWVLLPLQLLRRHQFVLPASGQGIFSPVHIDNLLDGIIAAMQEPRAQGQIFNITDGTDITCAEFFGYHQRWLGRSGSPPCLPTPVAKRLATLTAFVQTRVLRQTSEIGPASLAMLARHSGYRIDKAQRMLGYQPAISLEQGMRLTERGLREQGLITCVGTNA